MRYIIFLVPLFFQPAWGADCKARYSQEEYYSAYFVQESISSINFAFDPENFENLNSEGLKKAADSVIRELDSIPYRDNCPIMHNVYFKDGIQRDFLRSSLIFIRDYAGEISRMPLSEAKILRFVINLDQAYRHFIYENAPGKMSITHSEWGYVVDKGITNSCILTNTMYPFPCY